MSSAIIDAALTQVGWNRIEAAFQQGNQWEIWLHVELSMALTALGYNHQREVSCSWGAVDFRIDDPNDTTPYHWEIKVLTKNTGLASSQSPNSAIFGDIRKIANTGIGTTSSYRGVLLLSTYSPSGEKSWSYGGNHTTDYTVINPGHGGTLKAYTWRIRSFKPHTDSHKKGLDQLPHLSTVKENLFQPTVTQSAYHNTKNDTYEPGTPRSGSHRTFNNF